MIEINSNEIMDFLRENPNSRVIVKSNFGRQYILKDFSTEEVALYETDNILPYTDKNLKIRASFTLDELEELDNGSIYVSENGGSLKSAFFNPAFTYYIERK